VLEPDEGVSERMDADEEGGGGGRPTGLRLVGTCSPLGYRTSSSFTTALKISYFRNKILRLKNSI
jgi:hypothetical protein